MATLTKTKKTTTKTSTPKTTAVKTVKAEKVPAKKDAAKDLADLFEDGIKDLYWAEKNLLKNMPKMHKNASSAELKKSLEDHMKETENQIKRIEDCFKELGKKPQAAVCDAMKGLLEEGKGIMEETEMGAVRDAGIIAAAQKMEHYEIASYGTLAAFAKVLGYKQSLKLLLATLEEEKKCDEHLTQIADTNLNTKAK